MLMDETEKRLFDLFCSHYFAEYQHEYKSYEGRIAPLSRFQYIKENYCFLLEKWEKEKSWWYSRGEVS